MVEQVTIASHVQILQLPFELFQVHHALVWLATIMHQQLFVLFAIILARPALHRQLIVFHAMLLNIVLLVVELVHVIMDITMMELIKYVSHALLHVLHAMDLHYLIAQAVVDLLTEVYYLQQINVIVLLDIMILTTLALLATTPA